MGSPPRMRGKLASALRARGICGITPADAGKTCVRAHSGVTGRDHPRGCGENNCKGRGDTNPPGSPPRMRGKLLLYMRKVAFRRITPADAGKTRVW